MADAAPAQEMTIDELAQHASVPVSTVRMYQNKGLLPAPERRGRVGFYGADHRSRLQLIAHLQSRGFSLAAIKESLDSWNAGRSLHHLLGVSDVAPMLVREPVRISLVDLAKRFDGVGLTQSEIQRAAEIGLFEIDGADVIIANDSFAEIGPAIAKLGIPVSVILDEYEALRTAMAAVAEQFRVVFEQQLWEPFVERGMPADELSALTSTVSQLAELANNVVTTELQDRFADFAHHYLEAATGA